jgi:hypothetical protein
MSISLSFPRRFKPSDPACLVASMIVSMYHGISRRRYFTDGDGSNYCCRICGRPLLSVWELCFRTCCAHLTYHNSYQHSQIIISMISDRTN